MKMTYRKQSAFNHKMKELLTTLDLESEMQDFVDDTDDLNDQQEVLGNGPETGLAEQQNHD